MSEAEAVEAEAIEFEVADAGEPALGEGDPDAHATSPSPVSPGPVPAERWTPAEVAGEVAALFNVGTLIYGPAWTAPPSEFSTSGILLAPQLDRWLPKGAGGGYAGLPVALLIVIGELSGAIGSRSQLIRRGPRPLWTIRDGERATPPGTAGPAPGQVTPGMAASAHQESAYKLPRDLVAVIPERPLEGLGYEG